MHTNKISQSNDDLTKRLSEGTVSPEAAFAQVAVSRTEIMNWRARMEYARHNGTVAKIKQLEAERAPLSAAA